ncbi:unnamed protein product, partial [Ixodes persulcatus]
YLTARECQAQEGGRTVVGAEAAQGEPVNAKVGGSRQHVRVGVQPTNQLDEDDPVREDVGPLVVPGPVKALGRHPVRRPHDRQPQVVVSRRRDALGQPQVPDDGRERVLGPLDEHVLGRQVPVEDSARVEVRHATRDVQREPQPELPGERLGAALDQLLEATPVDVLCERVQLPLMHADPEEPEDVPVGEPVEKLHLAQHVGPVAGGRVHFEHHHLARGAVRDFVHFRKEAGPDLLRGEVVQSRQGGHRVTQRLAR